MCSLRFPVHPFIMELLHYLNIAVGQLMPNLWKIVISCMVIWTIIANGDIITLNEFVYLHCLQESKEFGYYELVPWDRRSRLIVDLPSSFRYWKSRYLFVLGDGWETLFDDYWEDVLRMLRRWETPQLGTFASYVTHLKKKKNYYCGVTSPINRIYPLWGASPSHMVAPEAYKPYGTHMVAPEAYKPYVGGNSNRCGTCDYNYKV